MNRYRIPVDRHTGKNLEILAQLWGHGDMTAIVAACVRRVVLEEIERARSHTNPGACGCRPNPDDLHF